MSILQLLLIGVVQGVTEWLPISSSAHVLLAADYFALEGRDELLINAISNAGTLAAMLLYFRKDIAHATAGGFELIAAPARRAPLSPSAKLALHILAATPIALIAGFAYAQAPDSVTDPMRSPMTIAASTALFGALLWWADVRGARTRTVEDMTIRHAVLIGATQAVAALIPGTSRSGITMTAARALGYERTEAARFGMLAGVPILAAVSLYAGLQLATAEAGGGTATLTDGLVVAGAAFVSGYASIWGLMALLKRMSFLPFVIYRFVLAGAIILGGPVLGLI
ncbi:MAG: undecaprenyl-diphosphate phosphatase [Pseudomonadota bacterium]